MMPDDRLSPPAKPSIRAALWPVLVALAVFALAALYYRLVWGDVAGLVAALDHCKELYCDFTRQYYPTGRDLLTTGRPSNGYFYSSFFALLLVPFGRLPLPAAVAAWSLVQLAGLLLLLLPAAAFYRASRAAFVLYVVLLALSMPLLHNLKWGQVSTLVTGGAFAALWLYRRGRVMAAAVVLGFVVAIKYYVAVLAFLFLLRRQWRFLAVFTVAVVTFWLLMPTIFLGPADNRAFYAVVQERVTHAATTWMTEDINAQYMPSVVGRWLSLGSGEDSSGPASSIRLALRLVGYAIFGLNLWAVARLVARDGPWAAEWAFALLFLSLPFAIDTSWPHYFVYLPFAQTLAWLVLTRTPRRMEPARWLDWGLWLASIVLASMPFFQLVGRWQDYSQDGVLFVANLCLFLLAHRLTSFPRPQVEGLLSPRPTGEGQGEGALVPSPHGRGPGRGRFRAKTLP